MPAHLMRVRPERFVRLTEIAAERNRAGRGPIWTATSVLDDLLAEALEERHPATDRPADGEEVPR